MKSKTIESLAPLLQSPKSIVIIGHRSPDGDAIGSTLALHHFLKQKGHKSSVIVPNAFADFLKWMPGTDQILQYDDKSDRCKKLITEADLIFTLDFNALSRSGDMEDVLKNTETPFAMIDHHRQPGNYAEFKLSDPEASSTCELIYRFFNKLDDLNAITPAIASCIYVGIMTDTGSFRFASTSSATHRIIADLIDKGADNARIHQNTFDTKSADQLKLLGTALDNLVILKEKHTAYITLTQKELDDHNFKKGDTEGFVNYGLSMKDIVLAAIFIENKEDNLIKISLRSKGDFDVNTLARTHFNGGGHINAAGGRSKKSMGETTAYFKRVLNDYEESLKST